MEEAHKKYIADQKQRADQEQDKYYKFYKDFDKNMNDRMKDYEDFKIPQLQRDAEAQRKIDEDVARKLADQDALRAQDLSLIHI